MKIIDAHCDTASILLDESEELAENSCHLSLEHLKAFQSYVQFFAAWVTKEEQFPYNRAVSILQNLKREISINRDHIEEIRNFRELESVMEREKHGAILSLEDGRSLEGKIEHLYDIYGLGVRAIALAWNDDNELTDGIMSERGNGLTSFGKQVVQEMNKLQMMVDVSHITVKGFWDVMDVSDAPVMASHSNCMAICNHKRNLNDAQIKALIQKDGFIGINLYRDFLTESDEAEVTDILRHMEHVLSLGGEHILGFGSDFDGMNKLPMGISHVGDYMKLIEEMHKIGYSDDLIDKITHKNMLNFIKRIEK